jgi:beta-glucosidase
LGNALADVLFGVYNPAGRLVQTWPKSVDDLPPLTDYDIRHGRTYMYFAGEPLFPFGFGLSYTTFAYDNLRTGAGSMGGDGAAGVRVDVRNTGGRAGEEVVQMYVAWPQSSVARPLKQLTGFKRVALEPGETKTVELVLRPEQLAYWDTGQRCFVVEPGTVRITVGSSSADIRLETTVAVTERLLAPTLTAAA